MLKRQKLELTWIGKENRPKLELRILLEDPEKSYYAPHRATGNDIFDSRLIFGGNLSALKGHSNGGIPWQYLLISHDVVAENMTLAGLAGIA